MPLSFSKFLLFGDSITEYSHAQTGFALAPALQDLYMRKLDVVTRGFSGYNTDQGVIVLREVLNADNANVGNIKLMYIFMGTNDAATTFQAVPLDRFKQNLITMISMAQDFGIKVILVGPGLHDRELNVENRLENGYENPEQPFLSNHLTRQYANAAHEVALLNKVPFVDLWLEFQRYGGWGTDDLLADAVDLSELLSDGIHYTPRAYEIFYDALVETIMKIYPELAPLSLPKQFPYYREIDTTDNEGSIMAYIDK